MTKIPVSAVVEGGEVKEIMASRGALRPPKASATEGGSTLEGTKSIDDQFRDWEGYAFGFGYGTGEPHTIGALKDFFGCLEERRRYDYQTLERELTPRVAWLMINALCAADIIEYGTSPRYGWLTKQGERLRDYVDAHTLDELCANVFGATEDYAMCYPDTCNCGPTGYRAGVRCQNPFWSDPWPPASQNP